MVCNRVIFFQQICPWFLNRRDYLPCPQLRKNSGCFSRSRKFRVRNQLLPGQLWSIQGFLSEVGKRWLLLYPAGPSGTMERLCGVGMGKLQPLGQIYFTAVFRWMLFHVKIALKNQNNKSYEGQIAVCIKFSGHGLTHSAPTFCGCCANTAAELR